MTDAEAYRSAREELRLAEFALMERREQVAAMRRALPLGPIAGEYNFDSTDGPVSLRELSTGADRPLVVYHFMFGGLQEQPCPMCSLWADGWNAVAHHLAESLDLVLVTQAEAARTDAMVAERGWTNLRWVSAADTAFKLDYGSLDDEGNQWPFFTVFEHHGDDLRLSWSGGAQIAPGRWRGVDLLSPVWHFLDLTRPGRGDWMPSAGGR